MNSLSIKDFKALINADKIDIVTNPKNNKLFMVSNGTCVGAVSTKCDLNKELQVVEIQDNFWCLCNVNTANVVKTI